MCNKREQELIKLITGITNRNVEITKNSNNHFVILIEGLSKPIYTSSTPSDRRANKNIVSTIKNQFRLDGVSQMLTPETKLKTVYAPTAEEKRQQELTLKQFLDMQSQNRIAVLNGLMLPALDALSKDIKTVMDSKRDDAILAVAEVLQNTGISIAEVQAFLSEPVQEAVTVEPVKETQQPVMFGKADRVETIKLMITILRDSPSAPCKQVREQLTTQHPDLILPVYGTFFGWYQTAQKQVTKSAN